MAGVAGYEVLQIKWYTGTATCTIALLGNPGIDKSACGFSLVDKGGGRAWPTGNDAVITDIFTLQCSGSNVSEQEQQLRYALKFGEETHTGVGTRLVPMLYARSALDDVTLSTAILGGELKEIDPVYGYVSARHKLDRFMLSITHPPFWSPLASSGVSIANVAPVATPVDVQTYAGQRPPGDLPNLVGEFSIERTLASSTIHELWASFRTNRDGEDYDAPVHFWDLGASAKAYSNNTTSNTSASATATVAAIWTPAGGADDSILTRVTVDAQSALGTTNARASRGIYRYLLRARATGTATFQVRVSSGNPSANVWNTSTRFTVNSSFFKLYSVGRIQIPAVSGQRSQQQFTARFSGFRVEAGILTAGTGNLEIDGIYLMPTPEGFVYAKTPDGVSMSGSSAAEMQIFNRLTGEFYGILENYIGATQTHSGDLELQRENWSFPLGLREPNKVSLILVYQDKDRHRLGDLVDVNISRIARYSRLGNEA